MPWSKTRDGTLPSLQNKSIAIRQIFTDVANEAIRDGEDEEAAIFAGIAAVSNYENV